MPIGDKLELKDKKATRITDANRAKLAADLKKRYNAGESIRSLATSTGRSYGFVHRILTETGVSLRGRGGATRGKVRGVGIPSSRSSGRGPELAIQIFLEDSSIAAPVEQSLRELLRELGVDKIRTSRPTYGSWYRSLTGFLKKTASSETAGEARRAVELQLLDRFQAGIDGVTGDAVAKLITALGGTRGAVVQVGSVLLVKVDDNIVVRHLTAREMIHWQQNPGLFKDPAGALAELQRALNVSAGSKTPGFIRPE